MNSQTLPTSRLLGLAARLIELSREMQAVGEELLACGFAQGAEMVGAGGVAGAWAERLVEESASK